MSDAATHASGPSEERPLLERRASVRHFPQQDLEGSVSQAGRPYKAVVRDLSATGIGLVVNQGFDKDTLLTIELQSADQSFSFSLLARVVHASSTDGISWLIGCSFVRELTEDEVQNMV